ncbi:MAG: CoA pyrophosphatase [Chloroflexi bacterium HGW-Chloroflexi-1]|nr:MAG: CoA pyrophosphatase [Chloroflexi bacterium HGW-Chloroflexi-1]
MLSSPIPVTITRLRAALCRPLPGLPGQMCMAPQPRPGTKRIPNPNLDCRNHRGQISLPGGSMEPGETAAATALREAQEELGIDPASLELLGALSPLYIPPSDFYIYPVVAYAAERPGFTPNPEEVAEVIEAPLAHLLAADTCQVETWEVRGQPVRVPFYAVGPHKVWGATAMVLSELVTLLSAREGSPAWSA